MNAATEHAVIKNIGAIAVCLMFLVIGIVLHHEHQVVAYLNIVFGGTGAVVLLIQLFVTVRNKYFPKPLTVKFPASIEIKQVSPSDDEVESWLRVFENDSSQFNALHGVDATQVDDPEYPWYVYFGAGEFIREEPFESLLAEAIAQALTRVEGVESAFREDTEKLIITGSPSGYDLVYEISAAIDAFMIAHELDWLKHLNKT